MLEGKTTPLRVFRDAREEVSFHLCEVEVRESRVEAAVPDRLEGRVERVGSTGGVRGEQCRGVGRAMPDADGARSGRGTGDEFAAVRVQDVTYTPDGLRLVIPRSKSDQAGAGQVVGVAYGERSETCPVRALRSYVVAAGAALAAQNRASPLTGPVFRKVDRWGRFGTTAITGRAVAEVVKQYAAAAGLDPALYSGHSLRAGFATTAARAGKPDRAIQKQTRHKSAAMLAEYVREGRLFDENASEGIGL